MRIILYTGKGGVGKTSVAAATACKIAGSGKKVLIASTDQAHSLGDAFDQKLDNHPVRIDEHLYGMEINVVEEGEKAWGNLKDYIKKILTARSQDGIEVEELLVFPGFEELFALFKIVELYQAGVYDALIVDCAPTGETMSLLKFPEMFEEWITKLLPVERKLVKAAGPAVEKTIKIPMPEDTVFDDIELLTMKMRELRTLLTSKELVSIRIVTTPEKIVVKEAKRNFAFLHLYDYNVDAVIVNKIYPEASMKGYFNQWIKHQEESLREIRDSFMEIPIFRLELQPGEIHSLPCLKTVSGLIYGDSDPMDVFFRDNIFSLDKEGDTYYFRVYIPFVDKKDMELIQKGDELHLTIHNQHRNILLPKKIRGLEISGAKYEDDRLNIAFSE